MALTRFVTTSSASKTRRLASSSRPPLRAGAQSFLKRSAISPASSLDQRVSCDEQVDVSLAKAAQCILGTADNRLPPNVEAGIHEHRTPRRLVEGAQQRVVTRIRLWADRLDPRRAIDVRHR